MKSVLVTSLSKKVPLAKALCCSGWRLIGADSNPNCIGRYFVDHFWQMPPLEQLSITDLLKFCKQQQVRAIIPTRDQELPFFAAHQHTLQKAGIAVMVSALEAVAVCLDKLLFYQTLSSWGYSSIPTAVQLKELSAEAYVVKERFGAGSRRIGLKLAAHEAQSFAEQLERPIFQPFIDGKEYSIDLYVDLSGHAVGAIVRLRELVVGGESQISVTLRYPLLEKMSAEIAERIGLYGHLLFQVLEQESGQIFFLECNPRFGGASTLSLAAGLETLNWFLLESEGQLLPPFVRTKEEKRLVRYPEDRIF